MLLVLDGAMREGAGARIETCRAGTVRYSPAGDRHVVDILDEGARVLIVEAIAFNESAGTRRLYLSDGDAAATMSEVRHQLYDAEFASPFLAEELVLRLFATMQRMARGRPDPDVAWWHAVAPRFHRDVESLPTLTELASAVSRHPNLVARAFRARYGVSIGRFRRRRQLHSLWRLLIDPGVPLAEVAEQGRFSDQSHMTRVVTRELLQTPQGIRDALARVEVANAPRGNWFALHEVKPLG